MKTLIKSVLGTSLSVSIAMLSAVVANGMPASALTLNSVTGSWTNPVGGGFTVTGVGTNEIRWGTPASTQKSGFKFDGVAPPSVTLSTETNFVLGTLTHFNFPISDPITSADLDISLNLGGTPQSFQYTFNINETPNTGTVAGCPSFQISGTPCDDKISFASGFSSSTFLIAGQEYTLQLLGFSSTANGSNPISQFITQENQASNAYLVGRITTPLQTVPEPTALIGLSLIGLGLFNRRLWLSKQS